MSSRNCYACREWNKCPGGYDYYYPSEIDGHFCWHQIVWLILCRDNILLYSWPSEPSGYIDQPGKPQPASHAPFEGSLALVCGLFSVRWVGLIKCSKGRENVLLLEKEMLQNRKFNQLSDEARSVVWYLIKDRRQDYTHWMNQNAWREKARV